MCPLPVFPPLSMPRKNAGATTFAHPTGSAAFVARLTSAKSAWIGFSFDRCTEKRTQAFFAVWVSALGMMLVESRSIVPRLRAESQRL